MKNMKMLVFVAALIVVVGGGAGIYVMNRSGAPVPTVSHGGAVRDHITFVDTLRANGATVEPSGSVDQPFFSVKGQGLKVGVQDVQTFEYADATAAQEDADSVSADGSTIGTSRPSWVGAPHFYKKGKLIVIYIGSDAKTLELLGRVMGTQFAGK
jgi:hypothetical protein